MAKKAKLVPIEGKPGLYTYENLKRDPKTELEVELLSLDMQYEIKRARIIDIWEKKHGLRNPFR